MIFTMAMVNCQKDNHENLVHHSGLCLVDIGGHFEAIELDKPPIYLNGGDEGFTNAIYDLIRYPAEARTNGIQGLCIINYVVTEEGMVEDIEAIQDPGGGIGDSTVNIIEVVTAGTSFSPGILHNNPVRVKKELDIRYKLE